MRRSIAGKNCAAGRLLLLVLLAGVCGCGQYGEGYGKGDATRAGPSSTARSFFSVPTRRPGRRHRAGRFLRHRGRAAGDGEDWRHQPRPVEGPLGRAARQAGRSGETEPGPLRQPPIDGLVSAAGPV